MSNENENGGVASDKSINSFVPGIALSVVVALAATYLSEHYNGPAMLFALLLGMAFNQLADNPSTMSGVRFSSKFILRVGVALLGVRITIDSIGSLGLPIVAIVGAGVLVTITIGYLIARSLKLSSAFAIVSASAVAICGASAALAIASVLPQSEKVERGTMLSVAAVTTLSTIAMIFYPVLIDYVGLDDRMAGVFLGATIHDVAQVVGAGYTISLEAGDTSTIVKLLRVALLFPIVVFVGLIFNGPKDGGKRTVALVPWFLVVFAFLVGVGSAGVLPSGVIALLSDVSRWCLLIAVAALGIRTSLPALAAVGFIPLTAIVLQTILLAVFVFGMLNFL